MATHYKIELTADEYLWLHNVVAEKMEFYSRQKHINYTEAIQIGKSVREKIQESKFPKELFA